jgi:hypothetical protein
MPFGIHIKNNSDYGGSVDSLKVGMLFFRLHGVTLKNKKIFKSAFIFTRWRRVVAAVVVVLKAIFVKFWTGPERARNLKPPDY